MERGYEPEEQGSSPTRSERRALPELQHRSSRPTGSAPIEPGRRGGGTRGWLRKGVDVTSWH